MRGVVGLKWHLGGRMHIHILGPVEVHAPGGGVDIKGMKRCALLGTLALYPGQLVSTTRLIDTLWEHAPPRSATSNIRTYVSDLRRLLGGSSGGRSRVTSHPTGYRLEIDQNELDLLRFERLVGLGEQAAKQGQAELAVELLEQADRLWRGKPCDGVELGSWVRARVAAIEDRRWAAMSCLVEVKLGLGEHTELVARLREMLAERPLCERTWAQLMTTLDRLGRKGDALAAFVEARQVLDAELGLEPGPELTVLQQRILSDRRSPVRQSAMQTSTKTSTQTSTQTSTNTRPPRCLPPAVPTFTGRREPLAELVGTLRVASEPGGPVVAGVSGSPGCGKTSLLVVAAHRMLPDFPDGQLYHTLGGVTSSPLRPTTVLADFLRSLGVVPADIPADVDERAAMYRSVLADRKVLVVLDDAACADQVRPLLPGAGRCRTLVSSRTRLTALQGAHLLHIEPFDDDESTQLLAELAGRERTQREPGDAARIVQICAGSALALRIAGARLATRPRLRLAALADRLVAERTRLDELEIGELSVRVAFESSYVALTPDARQAFRLLGLLGTRAVTAPTVSTLVTSSLRRSERVIEELVRASLLVPGDDTTDGELSYRLDPLLALYAAERADVEESGEQRVSAMDRVGTASARGRWSAGVGTLEQPVAAAERGP